MLHGVREGNDRWVPNDLLVLDDPLIRDDRQGGTCHAVSRKVPNNSLVHDDQLIHEDC